MIFIDTNIAIPLVIGKTSALSLKAQKVIGRSPLLVSPMVKLELQYLYELGKIKLSGDEIMARLEECLVISVSESPFSEVCKRAESISWTSDTFDRLIVAEAMAHNASLVTSDRTILKHYKKAVW